METIRRHRPENSENVPCVLPNPAPAYEENSEVDRLKEELRILSNALDAACLRWAHWVSKIPADTEIEKKSVIRRFRLMAFQVIGMPERYKIGLSKEDASAYARLDKS